MNESLCSTERLVSKANDRESYRLWFEFLKRASSDPKVQVNATKYKSWGDYANLGFETWWRKTGSAVTSLEQQTFLEVITEIPEGSTDIFIRVPASVTTTQAINQLRAILSGSNRTAAALNTSIRIRDGAEIRHSAIRAYLVTYDAHRSLSMLSKGNRVAGKDLLRAVRHQYQSRQVAYMAGVNRGQKVDEMPSSLSGASTVMSDIDPVADAQAIATVQRYLKKANEIIRNVANGKFPD